MLSPFTSRLDDCVLIVLDRIMRLCTLDLRGRVRELSLQLYGMKMDELMTLKKGEKF